MLQQLRQKLHQYKKWEPLAFFTGGFLFDALLLHRIDNIYMLVHQAIYLVVAASLIAGDLFFDAGRIAIPRYLEKAWAYREGVLHFLLGTLLNVYTIFYFKSASTGTAILFLLFLGLLLFLNEVRPAKISKHVLRNSLFSLCLLSYVNIIVSIVLGSTGSHVFILGVGVAYLLHALFVIYLKRALAERRLWIEIRMPFFTIALAYVLLYVFKVLPPVPLSVKYMGIYREVSRAGEDYRLGYETPSWKFWSNGDQYFEARPGEKIYCFVQIFSPTRFKDQLNVRWLYKDPRFGWQSWDAIPLNIVGGREEGYRGYTIKGNYQPGDWRVSIETVDGREVGRIRLKIVAVDAATPHAPLNYDLR